MTIMISYCNKLLVVDDSRFNWRSIKSRSSSAFDVIKQEFEESRIKDRHVIACKLKLFFLHVISSKFSLVKDRVSRILAFIVKNIDIIFLCMFQW